MVIHNCTQTYAFELSVGKNTILMTNKINTNHSRFTDGLQITLYEQSEIILPKYKHGPYVSCFK